MEKHTTSMLIAQNDNMLINMKKFTCLKYLCFGICNVVDIKVID